MYGQFKINITRAQGTLGSMAQAPAWSMRRINHAEGIWLGKTKQPIPQVLQKYVRQNDWLYPWTDMNPGSHQHHTVLRPNIRFLPVSGSRLVLCQGAPSLFWWLAKVIFYANSSPSMADMSISHHLHGKELFVSMRAANFPFGFQYILLLLPLQMLYCTTYNITFSHYSLALMLLHVVWRDSNITVHCILVIISAKPTMSSCSWRKWFRFWRKGCSVQMYDQTSTPHTVDESDIHAQYSLLGYISPTSHSIPSSLSHNRISFSIWKQMFLPFK